MTDREHIEKEKLRLSRAAWPYEDITPTDLALAVADAVRREERERCAVICETVADSHPSGIGPTSRGGVAIDCAAAIRSAVPLQPSAETCAHHATVAVVCSLCYAVATGHAFVGDLRYCHGDNDLRPTCFERMTTMRATEGDCHEATR